MAETVLSTLSWLLVDSTTSRQLGLSPGLLELRRAWPYSTSHLGLEYATYEGHIVAGQWLADPEQLDHVAQATLKRAHGQATAAIIDVADTRVLLQRGGADRHLPGLALLLAQPGSRLLVHRPERRAVVCLDVPQGMRFGKVVRPERLPSLVENGTLIQDLPNKTFATPELLHADYEMGISLWSALSGTSLHDLGRRDEILAAAFRAGAALSNFHTLPCPPNLGQHAGIDEVGVLQRWIELLKAFMPDWGSIAQTAAGTIMEPLAADNSPTALLHRDFYDKQVFIDDRGQVGLLDFDTLTTGEAALDLANALVHFELRACLGKCSSEQSAAAANAMLDGYQPNQSTLKRLDVYADATRLRLMCVYAFRACGAEVLTNLHAQLGQSIV